MTMRLLIVPYGIETNELGGNVTESDQLLIVPYGIETIYVPTLAY